MGPIPIDFLLGDDPAFPEDDEDDGAEACFRQELEVLIADEDDAPADEDDALADEEADAHWARQRAQLYEQVEQLRQLRQLQQWRRAAESAP